jgi:hypothetical protein
MYHYIRMHLSELAPSRSSPGHGDRYLKKAAYSEEEYAVAQCMDRAVPWQSAHDL